MTDELDKVITENPSDMKIAVVGVISVISVAALTIAVTGQLGIELSETSTGLFMAAITGIVALAK